MFTFDSLLKPAEVFEAIRNNVEEQDRIFLVGGVVRDLLLQRPIHDIDLVMEGNVRSLAKKVANSLDGDFFMLDSERETARVLYAVPGGERLVIDFASFRGNTLQEDLCARDFTINGMALALDRPDHLIDPLNGVQDLRNKMLRLCKSDALTNDALRVLRGVRFALDLDCKIVPETWKLMKEAAPELQAISSERKRDEIFRIFGGSDVSSAFRLLDRVGALALIFPDLRAYNGSRKSSPAESVRFEAVLIRLQKLEALLGALGKKPNQGSVQNMTLGAAVLQLNRFREKAQFYLDQQISFGRNVRELLMLAALISDPIYEKMEGSDIIQFGQPKSGKASQIAAAYGRSLALSQVEVKRLERMLANQPLLHALLKRSDELSPIEIYRYFRNAGETGIAVTFLVMADILAAYRSALPHDLWLNKLAIADQIWEAWWERHGELVDPPQVLTGNDFQDYFKIQRGPVIGLGLEVVREAQVDGQVTTKEDALGVLEKWLADRNP